MEKAGKKILCIENDIRAALYTLLLEQHNHTIFFATSITEAEDILTDDTNQIDSIIMNLSLDGTGLSEDLRKKVLHEGFSSGWLFYEEVLRCQYSELASHTIFFVSDAELNDVLKNAPGWYDEHKEHIVTKMDTAYKERILGLLDAGFIESGKPFDYETARFEVVLQERLNAELKRVNDHVAKISHEMRTPLTTIKTKAETLLSDPLLERKFPKTYKNMGSIYDSSSILNSIVDNLLDVHRITLGRGLELAIKPKPYSVENLMRDVLCQCETFRRTHLVDFNMQIKKNTPVELVADESRVMRIMINILSNAWKNTKKGFISLSVWIENDEGADMDRVLFCFSVADTGVGMTEEQVRELEMGNPNPSFAGNDPTVESTGLGMYITKELLDSMYGIWKIKSIKGEGTTITVKIPQGVANKELLSAGIIDSIKKQDKHGYRLKSLSFDFMVDTCVLIVDDTASNVQVFKDYLEGHVGEIDVAGDGEEAVEIIDAKIKAGDCYGIVFMDIQLPGITGIEATQRMRDMGYNKPIIAVTAYGPANLDEMPMHDGFDDYISKPFGQDELVRCLIEYTDTEKRHPIKNGTRTTRDAKERLRSYWSEANRCLSNLEAFPLTGDIADQDIALAKKNLHDIKGPLCVMDEEILSDVAAWLWQGFHARNLCLVTTVVPHFLNAVRLVLGRHIQEMTTIDEPASCAEHSLEDMDMSIYRVHLLAAADAFRRFRADEALNALDEIRKIDSSRCMEGVLNHVVSVYLKGSIVEAAAICETYTSR